MDLLRQACDRCHDKKLKCSRPAGSSCCSRCSKANVQCVFSPPTKPSRQLLTNNGHDNNAAFDWPDMMTFDQSQLQLPGTTATEPLVLESAISRTTEPSITEQLSAILVELDDMLREFPSSLDLHHVSRQYLREYADTVGNNFDLQSILDRLLRYTQTLAEIYPKATIAAAQNGRITAAEEDSLCTVPDCIHQDRTGLHTMALPKIDLALLNLLTSCHLRLLDVLDTITEHGRLCAFMVATLPQDYDPKFNVPEIRIGSFIAPTNTAASMLVSVLLELQSVLINRVKSVATAVSKVSSGTTREAKVLCLQCDILQDRAEATLAELKRLKSGMVDARVLQG